MSKIDLFCKNPLPTSKGGLNVKELQDALKLKGLPAKGTRPALIQRLCNTTKKQKPATPKPATQKKQKPAKQKKPATPKKQEKLAEPKWKYEKVILDYDPTRRVVYLSGELLKDFSNMVKSKVEHGGFIDFNKTGNVDRTLFGLGQEASGSAEDRLAINISDVSDFEVQFHTHPVGRTIGWGKKGSRFPPGYSGIFERPSENDVTATMIGVRGPRPRDSVHKAAQVDIVFAPDAVYTMYALDTDMKGLARVGVMKDPSEAKALADTIKNFLRSADELTQKTGNYLGIGGSIETVNEYIKLCRKYGVYIHRHSKFDSLLDMDHDEPINNWPEKIPLYLDPQEPVINITKRGVRQPKQQKA